MLSPDRPQGTLCVVLRCVVLCATILLRRLRTAQSQTLLNSQDDQLSCSVIRLICPSVRQRQSLGWAGTGPREAQRSQGPAAGVRNKRGAGTESGDKPFGGCPALPARLVPPCPAAGSGSRVGSQPLAYKGGQLSIPSKPFLEPYQMPCRLFFFFFL